MSLKRLILILVLLGAIAAVLVGFAAGSGDQKRHPKGTHLGPVTKRHPTGTQQGPVTRSRPSDPNGTEKYWTPERLKHAKPLPMGIPGRGTQPDGSGGSGSTAPAHR